MLDEQYFVGVIEGYYGMPWTFDQRKDLFCRMSKMGLNTYVYAPKNDLKHRSLWKELYNTTELSLLSSLIDDAKKDGLMFVYALSPGQGVQYSCDEDINILKMKLKQLALAGCECFALLFDDIPRNFSSNEDLVRFQSIAKAQCHLTNEAYTYLNKPKFMFCPTEYCDAFSYPNVSSSAYLKTIGEDLDKNINIMWTGEQVVSKIISRSKLQDIVTILKRKPVIWDNLHANDYDSSQLYLGPFSGRSVDLISCTSGMLSNPNCQLELNFVPFHTLGSWYKAALLYNTSCSVNESYVLKEEDFYTPRKALEEAVEEWKELFVLKSSSETQNGDKVPISRPFIETRDLMTIIDLFYLPYEIGTTARLLLEEFSLPCKAWWNPSLLNGDMKCEDSMPNFRSCMTLITKIQSDLLKSSNQILAIEMLPFLTNLVNVLKLGQKYLNHLKIHGNAKPLNLTSLLPFKEDLSVKLYSMFPFVMNGCQSLVKEPDFYALRPCTKEELLGLIQFKNKVFQEEIGNVENNIDSHPELAYVLEANNKIIGFCGACFQMSRSEMDCDGTPASQFRFNEFVNSVCKTYESQLFFSFSNVQHRNFVSKLIYIVLDILKCKNIKGVFTIFSESDAIKSVVCDVGFKLVEAHDGNYIYALKFC